MDYDVLDDNQLVGLVHESSEEAKDLLFDKYKYIIDIQLLKYKKAAKTLGYDYNDLYQDALVGFVNAINTYREEKCASLPTFITLCVDRKLHGAIIKAGRLKNKLINESLRFEQTYANFSAPLRDMISDNRKHDPLLNMVREEKIEEFLDSIKESLSDNEYTVYSLMVGGLTYNEIAVVLNKNPKQIDNTVQRLRNKIRKLIVK